MVAVIVTTQHRGVFFGRVPDDADLDSRTLDLTGAKMAIYWGTTKGVMELAHTGPTGKSRIGAPADCKVHDITAVLRVTDEAAKKWDAA